jgi:4-amino-4-deoxy-L-arabinose transferase-like glycosyltransferase
VGRFRLASRAESIATWVALAGAIALHLYFQHPFLHHHENDFDATYLYQPLAKGLLSHGFAFFGEELSLRAPPVTYAYQALFGADLPTVRWANLGLSVATLGLVFRSAWLLHSRLAGIAAAFAFAACPLMKEFIVAPLSEGPYIFLGVCWFWSLAEWQAGRGKAFLAIAAISLALAVLTRATLMYWIVVLIAAFAWLTLRKSGEARRRAQGALAAHVAAAIPPLAFTAKNLVIFGLAFVATGAGNALYQGNHPVTRGYDAPYVGLVSDVGQITREESHLTLRGETRLMTVAKAMIRDADPVELAQLHALKLAAFLFVTDAHPSSPSLRSWRIALLILAALGVASIRDPWLRALLVGIFAYQVATHIPVLYTHRYSIAIDPWLMIAAGVGAAAMVSRRRPVEIALVAGTLVAGIGLGRYAMERSGPPEPDVFRGARMLVWEGAPGRTVFETDHPEIGIAIRHAPLFHRWNANILVFEATLHASAGDDRCGDVIFTYKPDSGPLIEGSLEGRLVADGVVHRHQWGMEDVHMRAEGTLRIALACARGGSLDIRRIAVYTPVAGVAYAKRYLGLPAPEIPIEE